jgi:prefoldin subunit 5
LADGEQNIEDLTREIKGIQQDIELYSDEITGLKASIQKNENAIKGVDRQIAMVKQDMAVAKAIEAARQYNRIAEELGKVLIDLHSAISETNGRQAGGRIYKPNCELTGLFPDVCSLPKLFIKGEFECPDALKNYPENIQNHHYHTSQLS